MITEFGKKLRIIRIRNDELLLQMAEKLSVTSSYLSAIENGKRNIPKWLIPKVCEIYKLKKSEKLDLLNAADASKDAISFNLSKASNDKKIFVLALARQFDNLDKNTVKQLQQSLKNCKGVKSIKNA